jgi:hypothetical protein
MLLLGDIGQQMDVNDLSSAVQALREDARSGQDRDVSQDRRIRSLQTENEELKLYVAALVKVLKGKGTLDDNDIEAIVNSVESAAKAPS